MIPDRTTNGFPKRNYFMILLRNGPRYLVYHIIKREVAILPSPIKIKYEYVQVYFSARYISKFYHVKVLFSTTVFSTYGWHVNIKPKHLRTFVP